MIKTHKVIFGIFFGLEFNGTEAVCAGQKIVWNNETIGQGHPWKKCTQIQKYSTLINQ